MKSFKKHTFLAFIAIYLQISLFPAAGNAEPDKELEARRIEAGLLSRQVDLTALRTWSPQRQQWSTLASPHAPMLVLHLWAADCKPCVSELPVLRSFVQSWRDSADTQFLFVAETESEERLLSFWNSQMAAESPRIPLVQIGDERIRSILETGRQPLTLILDTNWVVRQAFVGSVAARATELSAAMSRFLAVLRAQGAKALRASSRKGA